MGAGPLDTWGAEAGRHARATSLRGARRRGAERRTGATRLRVARRRGAAREC